MSTRLGRFCEMIMEAGWLTAAVLTPLFFHTNTNTIFEPDKAALLQTIVWVMILAWATRFLQRPMGWIVGRIGRAIAARRAARAAASDDYNPPEVIIEPVARGSYRLPALRLPNLLEILAILFALLVIISTITSVHGLSSLLGSYHRAQGLLTLLSYVVILLLLAGHLRSQAQVERLFLAVTLGSLPVTLYGLAQTAGLDPLPWSAPRGTVASTLGNAAFLAGYLTVVLPLSVAGALMVLAPLRGALRPDRPRGLRLFAPLVGDLAALVGIYLPAILCQFLVLLLAGAPYALLGVVLAGIVFLVLMVAGVLLSVPGRVPHLMGLVLTGAAAVVIALILLGAVGLAFTDLVPASALSLGAEGEPRPLVWSGARAVVTQWPLANPDGDLWRPLRPVVGYGPETFAYPFNQVYPLALMQLTGGGSVADRAYNALLQTTAELGYLGLALHLALLVGGLGVGLYALARGRSVYYRLALAGLLAALLAGMVHAQFYPTPISGWLFFWLLLGLLIAVGRQARERPLEEQVYRVQELEEPQRAYAVFTGLLLLGLWCTVFFVASFSFTRWESLPLELSLLAGPWVVLAILVAVVNNGLGFWQRRRLAAPEVEARAGRGALAGDILRVTWTVVLVLGAVVAVLVSAGLVLSAAFGLGAGRAAVSQVTPDLVVALTLVAVVVGLLAVAISLKRPAVPLKPIGWGSVVTFVLVALAALVLALVLAGVVFLTVYQPTLADVAHKQALAYDNAGQWARSIELHQQAVNLAPNRDWYYTFLGRACIEFARSARPDPNQGMEKAVATFVRARELNPLNPDHAANLGRLYVTWGEMTADAAVRDARIDQAGPHYEAAVKLAPHHVKLLREMADMYFKHARLTEAARAFERIVNLTPADAEAWSYLGYIYAQQKKADQAIAAYEQAIRLQPDQYKPYEELARLYQAAGNQEKALDMAKKALERAPDTARPAIQQLINELER